ncbi:MAG TPA: MFS transporter, partial [Chloroflexota bacterium]
LYRAIQGIGAGSINTLAFIVMGDLFSARERGKWQAVNNIGFATASAIGPSIGGILSDTVSWRWIFLINVPLCLATLVVVLYGLREPQRATPRPAIDWAGALWSVVGIVAILLALTWGGREYAWMSPQILGLGGLTVVAGGLLWWAERHAHDPLIPAGIFRGRVVAHVCVGYFATFFVWFTMILLAPLRLQLVLGASATEAGVLLTPGIVLSPICAFFAGQVLSRTGRYRPTCRVGAVLQVVGLVMLLYVPPTLAQLWVLVSFAVVGMGTGLLAPSMMIAFQNAIPQQRLGAGMGLVSLFRQFGSSVGTTVVGAIVGESAAIAATAEMSQAIQYAVVVQVIAGLAVVVAVWLMAELPLGTSRGASDADGSRKAEAWTAAAAEH